MKQKTMDAMRPVVEAYARYAGSKEAFCQERGIAKSTLDYWRRKLRGTQGGTSSFVALELAPTIEGQSIELHYPNGVRALVPLEVPTHVLQTLLSLAG